MQHNKGKFVKSIVYYLDKLSHVKVFRPFMYDKSGRKQHILVPASLKGKVDLPNSLFYKNEEHAKQLIKKISPDVFVQSRNKGGLHDFLDKMKIKKVMIGHGTLTKNDVVVKLVNNSKHVYKRYDLICVATEKFDKWTMVRGAEISEKMVAVTGLAQFDSLYDIVKNNKFGTPNTDKYDKTILVVGGKPAHMISKGKHAPRVEHHRCIFEVAKLCHENNWQLLIKPRSNHLDDYLRKNIKTVPWAKKYVDMYDELLKNENVRMLDGDDEIYRYFNVDLFVLDGWSTAEMEICLVRKPMVIVNETTDGDYLDTVATGAAKIVTDYNAIRKNILAVINSNNSGMIKKQDNFVLNAKIKFDGENYKRILKQIDRL